MKSYIFTFKVDFTQEKGFVATVTAPVPIVFEGVLYGWRGLATIAAGEPLVFASGDSRQAAVLSAQKKMLDVLSRWLDRDGIIAPFKARFQPV